jgi:cell division septation protein DedD
MCSFVKRQPRRRPLVEEFGCEQNRVERERPGDDAASTAPRRHKDAKTMAPPLSSSFGPEDAFAQRHCAGTSRRLTVSKAVQHSPPRPHYATNLSTLQAWRPPSRISSTNRGYRPGPPACSGIAGITAAKRVGRIARAGRADCNRPPAIAGARPVARPRVTAGDGFFLELSSPKTEAEALSVFRALKSEYAVLKGYELEIRRKDEGGRGVIYSVQVGPFESQDDGEQLCEQLKTAGGICFVTRN